MYIEENYLTGQLSWKFTDTLRTTILWTCENVLLKVLFIYFSQCKFDKFLMSFLKAQVSFPSSSASIFSVMKHNSSVLFFISNIIYFGSRSQLKSKIFRFLSVWVKIPQIPYVNFQMTSQFLFKFCIILHGHDT